MATPFAIVYSAAHERHDPKQEFLGGHLLPSFEKPARAIKIFKRLTEGEQTHAVNVVPPTTHDQSAILAVHSRDYCDYVSQAHAAWVADGHPVTSGLYPDTIANRRFDFGNGLRKPTGIIQQAGFYCYDCSTPLLEHTYQAAIEAVDVALTGADLLRKGYKATYALCRPPGHHAGSDYCGGYCYFNNAAIAAAYLRDADRINHHANLVAILDIDYHHGNGTQEIFYDSSTVFYVSLHGDPNVEYPYYSGHKEETGKGSGVGFNLNIPLPKGTGPDEYIQALDQALIAIKKFAPKYLVVSAGIDTYEEDPIGGFKLTIESYELIGKRISDLNLPTLIVHEGGYHINDMPECIAHLLEPFRG